jgi:hypothetical protein
MIPASEQAFILFCAGAALFIGIAAVLRHIGKEKGWW